MRVTNFASFDAQTLRKFAKLNIIIKFANLISFCSCLFIYKNFLSKSSSDFPNAFTLTCNTHEQSVVTMVNMAQTLLLLQL